MNYASSRSVRRFVGRLSKGERVIESLERLCKKERVRAGAIQAIGIFRQVQLQSYTAEAGYINSLDASGHFEVVSFTGNISTLGDQIVLNTSVLLSSVEHGQFLTLGGRLFEAEVFAFEFVIEAWEDLKLERRLDARTGLPVWNKIETLVGESITERTAPRPQPAPPIAQAPEPEPEPEPVRNRVKVEAPPAEPIVAESTAHAEAFTGDGTIVKRSSAPEVVRRPTFAKPEPKPEPKVVRAPKPEPRPAPAPEPDEAEVDEGGDWAAAVAASEELTTSEKLGVTGGGNTAKLAMVDDWPDMPDFEPGEFLKHQHFGICKILFVEEDDFVRVRVRGGKVIDIKLEVCEFELEGDYNGRNLYKCEIVQR